MIVLTYLNNEHDTRKIANSDSLQFQFCSSLKSILIANKAFDSVLTHQQEGSFLYLKQVVRLSLSFVCNLCHIYPEFPAEINVMSKES